MSCLPNLRVSKLLTAKIEVEILPVFSETLINVPIPFWVAKAQEKAHINRRKVCKWKIYDRDSGNGRSGHPSGWASKVRAEPRIRSQNDAESLGELCRQRK